MARLYQPGKQKETGGKARPVGGFSSVPRGRQFQLDFYPGVIVIDKAKDPGREGFEEEAAQLIADGAEDAQLYAEYGNLESGEAVWFGWTTQPDGRVFRTNLTRCTEEELLAFRDVVMRAVEDALPEVQRRDEKARRAERDGFYGLYRVTRASPQTVDFARKKSEYEAGIQGGLEAPDDAPDGGEPGSA